MRADQFERLQGLSEQLTEVLITELDPTTWDGHGVALGKMDRNTRGDRYWCKRNASATLTTVMKLHQLGVLIRGQAKQEPGAVPEGGDDEQDLEAELAAAEQEAQRLIDRAIAGSKHGKRKARR